MRTSRPRSIQRSRWAARALRSAQVDVVVLAERLHSERVGARFVPEAVAVDLDTPTAFGEDARHGRVERVADRGTEHHVGRLEQRPTVLVGLGPCEQLRVQSLVSSEGVDRAHLVRERLEVAVPLEGRPWHDRREAHRRRRLVGADAEHQSVDRLGDRLVARRPSVHPVHAGRDEHTLLEQPRTEAVPGLTPGLLRPDAGRLARGTGHHGAHSPRWTRRSCALFPMIRSLLTIRAAPIASRRWRPRQ